MTWLESHQRWLESFFQQGRYLAPLAVAGGILFLFSNGAEDLDDAAITYRYALNLAEARGFVYNEGERLQGTSTPLYTLALAALHRLSSLDIPSLSNFLNLVFSILTLLLTCRFAQDMAGSGKIGFLAGLFLLALGPFVALSMAGMETPLYTFLTLACLHHYWHRRYLALGILGGLLVVTRVDGMVLAGFLGLLMTWKLVLGRMRWQDWLRTLLPFALIAGAWQLFAWLYFGSLLPQSFLAKQEHGKAASAFWPLVHFFQWQYLFLLPTLLLAVFMRRQAPRALGLLLAFAALYLLAYLVAGLDFYDWYLVPLMPLFALLFALAAGLLRERPRWQAALVGSFLLLGFGCSAYEVARTKAYLCRFEVNRVIAGNWLARHVSPEAWLEAGAIGHVGWRYRGRILDAAKLVTPMGDARQGDLLVAGKRDLADLARRQAGGYEPLKTFPHGHNPIHIWIKAARRDSLLLHALGPANPGPGKRQRESGLRDVFCQ